MNRFMIVAASTVLMACSAFAQCTASGGETKATEAKAGGKCCMAGDKKGECSSTCSEGAKAVAVKMPKMSYKVGDKEVCCSSEASELAKGDKSKIQFVVAGKSYTSQAEATDALATALDGFMNEVITVKYAVGDSCVACPTAAKEMASKDNKKVQYRVASFNFEKQEDADKAVKVAKEAAAKVEMKMMVGEKCYQCPMSAGEAAKKESKSVEYVVGEKKSCCDKEAKVMLAKARIDAAMKAMSEAPGIAKA